MSAKNKVRGNSAETYKRDGWTATLIRSTLIHALPEGADKIAAIYRRSKAGAPDHYEVVICRHTRGNKSLGIPAGYALPSPSSWGSLGWTFMTEVAAIKKYLEVSSATSQ